MGHIHSEIHFPALGRDGETEGLSVHSSDGWPEIRFAAQANAAGWGFLAMGTMLCLRGTNV